MARTRNAAGLDVTSRSSASLGDPAKDRAADEAYKQAQEITDRVFGYIFSGFQGTGSLTAAERKTLTNAVLRLRGLGDETSAKEFDKYLVPGYPAVWRAERDAKRRSDAAYFAKVATASTTAAQSCGATGTTAAWFFFALCVCLLLTGTTLLRAWRRKSVILSAVA